MKAFALTRKAIEDLKSIARFTEKRWGRDQRYLYAKQLDEVFQFLAETPSIGKKCEYIKIGYRKFPQGSHVIYYRETSPKKITIIRILHKNMDVESKFTNTERRD